MNGESSPSSDRDISAISPPAVLRLVAEVDLGSDDNPTLNEVTKIMHDALGSLTCASLRGHVEYVPTSEETNAPGALHMPFPEDGARRQLPQPSERDTAAIDNYGLTLRQVQILNFVMQGYTNGRIGTALYMSEDTVKTHLRRVFTKLRATDRAHAVSIFVGAVERPKKRDRRRASNRY